MAKLGTINLTGISKRVYSFDIYNFPNSWNEVCAVYVVTVAKENPNGGYTHTIIYVGQTDNLQQRFSNHHKQNCFDIKSANRLCVIIENNEKSRLDIEADLINAYNAPCND